MVYRYYTNNVTDGLMIIIHHPYWNSILYKSISHSGKLCGDTDDWFLVHTGPSRATCLTIWTNKNLAEPTQFFFKLHGSHVRMLHMSWWYIGHCTIRRRSQNQLLSEIANTHGKNMWWCMAKCLQRHVTTLSFRAIKNDILLSILTSWRSQIGMITLYFVRTDTWQKKATWQWKRPHDYLCHTRFCRRLLRKRSEGFCNLQYAPGFWNGLPC